MQAWLQGAGGMQVRVQVQAASLHAVLGGMSARARASQANHHPPTPPTQAHNSRVACQLHGYLHSSVNSCFPLLSIF